MLEIKYEVINENENRHGQYVHSIYRFDYPLI